MKLLKQLWEALLMILLDLASIVFICVVAAGLAALIVGLVFYFLLIMCCWMYFG